MWRPICACAIGVCCVIHVQDAGATVPFQFDAVADFSTTVNTETSTWSYRYEDGTTPNGIYPLLPTYGPANGNWSPTNPGAWNTGSSGLPEIGVNLGGTTVSNTTTTPGDNFSLTNGTLFIRPVAGKLVVLS